MKKILLRIPAEWLDEIDELRGDVNRNEFLRECVRARLGKRRFKRAPGRGRPRVADEEDGD